MNIQDWIDAGKPLNSFIHGDCMEGMKQITDNYFDLAIVDPPYGIDFSNKKIKGKTVKDRYGWQIYKTKEWDKKIPNQKYFNELFRISKNQIIWGGNYFTEYLKPSRCWIVWYKVPYEFTLSQAELAWCSFDSRIKVFERMTNRDRGFLGKNIHPTQKPIILYRWLLKNYAQPEWKILDTHVGSGSSIIACEKMGFDYCGFEIDPEYWEGANARLEKEREKMRQTSLFGEMQA